MFDTLVDTVRGVEEMVTVLGTLTTEAGTDLGVLFTVVFGVLLTLVLTLLVGVLLTLLVGVLLTLLVGVLLTLLVGVLLTLLVGVLLTLLVGVLLTLLVGVLVETSSRPRPRPLSADAGPVDSTVAAASPTVTAATILRRRTVRPFSSMVFVVMFIRATPRVPVSLFAHQLTLAPSKSTAIYDLRRSRVPLGTDSLARLRRGSETLRAMNIDGGIHEVPVPPGVPGRLWLCGKHKVGPDHWSILQHTPADVIVCLTQRHELEERYPDYTRWLLSEPSQARWFPIHDLNAPGIESFVGMVDEVADLLRAGKSVVVHCAAGIGRAGTTAVGVMMRMGMPEDDALAHVAAHRPMAGPEAGSQRIVIRELAERIAAAL